MDLSSQEDLCVGNWYSMRPTLKICRCSAHNIIPLCGENEENVPFLVENLGGVTQQEARPEKEPMDVGGGPVPGRNHLCEGMEAPFRRLFVLRVRWDRF